MFWGKSRMHSSGVKFHAWLTDEETVCGYPLTAPKQRYRREAIDSHMGSVCRRCAYKLAGVAKAAAPERRKPLKMRGRDAALVVCPVCHMAGLHSRICPAYVDRWTINPVGVPA